MNRQRGLAHAIVISMICAIGAYSVTATTASSTSIDDDMAAALGKALFKRVWVPAPSSTRANDGLGPLFNGRSCAQCHSAATAGRLAIKSDGRLAESGAIVRLSNSHGAGDPIYGSQVQTRAVLGIEPEASVRINFRSHVETFDDGAAITLRRPVIQLDDFSSGRLSDATEATLILAPSLRTAARIAQIDAAAPVFGLKASASSLDEMTSLAFLRDLGLSTPHFPIVAGDCTAGQAECLSAPHGAAHGAAEISADIVVSIARYISSLDSESSPQIEEPHGAELFGAIGCAFCHAPTMPGRQGKPVIIYSDLALHPLGDALAGLTETKGQQRDVWRTAPLIHLESRLKAGSTLLHDGRAQTVAEAILWHGGAAEGSRSQYKALSRDDRAALERYVLSR